MTDDVDKVFDPFLGREVEISARLTDRLRGRYASGPTLPNGEPEFGWREFGPKVPIQLEAAAEIERLRGEIILLKAAADGAGSLLLDVQRDCIAERQALTAAQAEIEKLRAERDAALTQSRAMDIIEKAAKRIEEIGDPLAAAQAENKQLRAELAQCRKSAEVTERLHDGLLDENEKLRAELVEYERLFDLRWAADMRAVRMWRKEAPGRDLTFPDRTDLVLYLLQKLDEKP